MAKKRMFNIEIVDTDLFLEMPQSTQNLYFHLGMRADDDGFISNPKRIIKIVGANQDDLRILITKKFIIPFETGVIVIRHWKLNNYLRADRYTPTIHKLEKSQLRLAKDGSYMVGIPSDNQLTTPDIDLDKDIDINNNIYGQNGSNDLPGPKELWEEQFEKFYSKYPKKVKKQGVKKWFEKNTPSNELFSSMMNSLEQFRASADWQKDGGQFIPYPTAWLNQKRWEDESIPQKYEKTTKANFEQRQYSNLDSLYANANFEKGVSNEH